MRPAILAALLLLTRQRLKAAASRRDLGPSAAADRRLPSPSPWPSYGHAPASAPGLEDGRPDPAARALPRRPDAASTPASLRGGNPNPTRARGDLRL